MQLSPTLQPLQMNPNVAWSNSWFKVSNDQNVPLYAAAVYDTNQVGANGFNLISTTNTLTGGPFNQIVAITNTVFTGITAVNGTQYNSNISIGSVTFPAGFTISGSFSAIKLASGSVLVYNA
jgi:hypothetical protein